MNIDWVSYQCWVCGVPFCVSSTPRDAIKRDKGVLFCPRGCRLGFGKSQAEEIREEMQAQLNEQTHARLVAEKERDKAIKDKRKVERRIAHGVCPCCNQTFADIANHMLTEHKDFRLPEGKRQKLIQGAA